MTYMTYPVGDFLIRVKNAALAGRREVTMPKTKITLAVAKVLEKEGFLREVKVEKENILGELAIKNKKPVLMGLHLVSKPGLRLYMKIGQIEKYKGPETFILSTPVGVISSKEAKKKRLGGEVIAKVW